MFFKKKHYKKIRDQFTTFRDSDYKLVAGLSQTSPLIHKVHIQVFTTSVYTLDQESKYQPQWNSFLHEQSVISTTVSKSL